MTAPLPTFVVSRLGSSGRQVWRAECVPCGARFYRRSREDAIAAVTRHQRLGRAPVIPGTDADADPDWRLA